MIKKNRVAIVSENSDLATFFELEAIACDCSVQVLRSPPKDPCVFDRIILDAKAGYCLSNEESCRIVTVVTDVREQDVFAVGPVWEWPVSIRQVRTFFQGIEDVSNEKPSVLGASETDTEPTVYLLSDKKRLILYRNQTIYLSQSEWQLLLCLGDHRGEAVDRETLIRLFGGSGNIVDVYVHSLRKKLEEPFGIRLIYTVRGKGYRLSARLNRMKEWTEASFR